MSELDAQPFWRDSRLIRFLFVGMMNTVVGYSLYALGLWAGLHYSTAIVVATVLGILFNFKSTGGLVFQSRDNSRLLRFIAVYGVLCLVNTVGVGLLLLLGIAEWLGGMYMIPALAVLSFVLNRRYVFRA